MAEYHLDPLPVNAVSVGKGLSFGAELRRIRIARGLSLGDLARGLHFSKGYLSKVETGARRPNVQFARACDTLLEAGGALVAIAQVKQDVQSHELIDPHRILSFGSELIGAVPASAIQLLSQDRVAATSFETLFVELRRMGRLVSSHLIDHALAQQTRMLVAAAYQANGVLRTRLFDLAARFAEYTGWMLQESGAEHEALAWTTKAEQIAEANHDAVMGVQALVRRALFALYRGDAQVVIELAGEASDSPLAPTWLRAQAFQRLAQGCALAGESDATYRALDKAAELTVNADMPGSRLRLGPMTVANLLAFNTAWCLVDLGHGQRAAEILDREFYKLTADTRRARARTGMRRALAHAIGGSVEQACVIVQEILPDVICIQSATINTDVARVYRTLVRWQGRAVVADVLPKLAEVLHTGARWAPSVRGFGDERRP